MKSAPFKKVFENNVDDRETFAISNTDIDKQIIKTLEGPNRAFFHSKARILTKEEFKCKVIFQYIGSFLFLSIFSKIVEIIIKEFVLLLV